MSSLPSSELAMDENYRHPAWLAELAETVPVGIVVIDTQGKIVWSNAELLQQFRYTSDELQGKSIETLLPERFRKDHVALRSGYAAAPSARSMGSGRELFGCRQDGFEFPVEIGLRPLRTAQGMMFVATVVDISARRQAEAMFRKVIEAAPCGMLLVDANQRILLLNSHLLQLFGYERDELINQSLEKLIPLRHRGRHGAHVNGYVRNATMRAMGPDIDLTALRKDGSEFSVEIGLNPVQMDSGHCTLATVVDVTARKQTEQRLKRANADLEEFNYIAAHDLRSPLRGIADLSGWIAEDLGEAIPKKVKDHIQRMQQRVARLDALIENLLTYARAGVAEVQTEQVEVASWLADEIEFLNAPPSITFKVSSDVPSIKILKTPLSTVLRNLMSNAVKYNDKEQGLVEIDIRHMDTFLSIAVCDNGPGIPENAQERIFKLFQRLSSKKDGTGIGLALVKRIVEAHGGSIRVSGRGELPGAIFQIFWPYNTRNERHVQ